MDLGPSPSVSASASVGNDSPELVIEEFLPLNRPPNPSLTSLRRVRVSLNPLKLTMLINLMLIMIVMKILLIVYLISKVLILRKVLLLVIVKV